MNRFIYILVTVVLSFAAVQAYAQTDKKDVRRGNRDFRKEEYREAEIDYRKALVKDSLSVAANYNLANTLYRQGDYAQALQTLSKNKEAAALDPSSADYFFNLGDAAIQQKDWQTAVDAFAQSLIRNPDDMDAKENFIYAKKMLQNQQNQQNQNQQNQDNQDQNQNQDQQNQDNQDQNQDDQDKNQDQQNQDQNQDDQKEQPRQGEQPKITPQAAQQMLQAIQAKEKETQDKVNKQKAEALKSRQKEKNW
ncbi:MAG: tetratricopeptide repeat protein [Bacteroidales bacterium]|nr:tetratricopeptide repeat protein [Bacteroidales bacterium]